MGVQANGQAKGGASRATGLGVGLGEKAVPAQKVNPPRFAFGEQARRSGVGGGDGGSGSFAQKFMQHQREHRREQEGSEVLNLASMSFSGWEAALLPAWGLGHFVGTRVENSRTFTPPSPVLF